MSVLDSPKHSYLDSFGSFAGDIFISFSATDASSAARWQTWINDGLVVWYGALIGIWKAAASYLWCLERSAFNSGEQLADMTGNRGHLHRKDQREKEKAHKENRFTGTCHASEEPQSQPRWEEVVEKSRASTDMWSMWDRFRGRSKVWVWTMRSGVKRFWPAPLDSWTAAPLWANHCRLDPAER